MGAYRDLDPATLEIVRQHLAIAEALRETEVELSAKLTSSSDQDERRAPATAWDDMWNQLDQARAVAVQWSRDVRAYDAARVMGGAHIVDPILGIVLARQSREAAEDAVDALRAAFPEVVVPGKPRAPRLASAIIPPTHGPIASSPPRSVGAAQHDDKVATYTVLLQSPGYGSPTDKFARFSTHPIGRFGHRCVSCNRETEARYDYRPHTAPNVSAGKVRIPRCRDCMSHIPKSPTSELLLLVIG